MVFKGANICLYKLCDYFDKQANLHENVNCNFFQNMVGNRDEVVVYENPHTRTFTCMAHTCNIINLFLSTVTYKPYTNMDNGATLQ